MSDDEMKILVPPATLQRVVAGISRRRFLEVGLGGVAAAAILAACGGDNSGSSSGASTSAGAAASGGGNSGANKYNLFTWAEYDDPDLMKKFGDMTIDVYNSNEDAIAKLEAGGGTSGYDMVVPTGVYIPQMVSKSLLEEIDVSRIPNFVNLEQAYISQPWDPGNKHSVCKDWGTTGWIYDNTVITTPINSWQDFLDAAKSEGVAGKVSIIDSPADVTGLYFWAKGIDWNTTNPADLDAAEQYLTKELAPHLKALDSYPGINLTQGNYVLSQVFNGDARQGLRLLPRCAREPAVEGRSPGARDRAVLDKLPGAHDCVAHRVRAEGLPVELAADDRRAGHAVQLPRLGRGGAARGRLQTTCRS